MRNAWSALMGIGYGSWENRAVEAARSAIDSPLLELSVAWAKGMLFNITGWTDLSMFEVDEAARIITDSVDSEANIIFWATVNEDYNWELKITVVATWFDEKSNQNFSSTKTESASSKLNPFGRTSMWDSRVMKSKPAPQKPQDDLDVPTFLRKKM
jgi:cell division protein FtsZ